MLDIWPPGSRLTPQLCAFWGHAKSGLCPDNPNWLGSHVADHISSSSSIFSFSEGASVWSASSASMSRAEGRKSCDVRFGKPHLAPQFEQYKRLGTEFGTQEAVSLLSISAKRARIRVTIPLKLADPPVYYSACYTSRWH
jgi:hypothetical protein